MSDLLHTLSTLFNNVLRVAVWCVLALLALFMMFLALGVLLIAALWSLVRGRRPSAPVFVAQWQRRAQQHVWPTGATPRRQSAEVVDVEVREVDDHSWTAEDASHGRRLPPQPPRD